MKTKLFLVLAVFFITLLFVLHGAAQDYMKLGLPNGAKARLGKGRLTADIAYSPDSTHIAIATKIGTWLYNTRTSEEHLLLVKHTYPVTSLVFSPDSSMLAGGCDHSVRRRFKAYISHKPTSPSIIYLWDVAIGEHLKTFGHISRVESLTFSPDGTMLASGSGSAISLWDIETGNHIKSLIGHIGAVYSIVFSVDGMMLASGSADKSIRLWDVETGNHIKTFTGHEYAVEELAFAPDTSLLASSSRDDRTDNIAGDTTIRLWDV